MFFEAQTSKIKTLIIYEKLKNDKAKTIKMLEDLVASKENLIALNQLKGYYDDADKKDDVEKMIHDVSTRYPYSNDLRLDYIKPHK